MGLVSILNHSNLNFVLSNRTNFGINCTLAQFGPLSPFTSFLYFDYVFRSVVVNHYHCTFKSSLYMCQSSENCDLFSFYPAIHYVMRSKDIVFLLPCTKPSTAEIAIVVRVTSRCTAISWSFCLQVHAYSCSSGVLKEESLPH